MLFKTSKKKVLSGRAETRKPLDGKVYPGQIEGCYSCTYIYKAGTSRKEVLDYVISISRKEVLDCVSIYKVGISRKEALDCVSIYKVGISRKEALDCVTSISRKEVLALDICGCTLGAEGVDWFTCFFDKCTHYNPHQ